MKNLGWILRDAAGIISRRFGTAFAAYLIAQGIPADLVDQLIVAGGVFGGVLVDLGVALYQDRTREIGGAA